MSMKNILFLWGEFNATKSDAKCKKQKTFPEVFSTFLKHKINFEHFEKKDDPHTLCISDITD